MLSLEWLWEAVDLDKLAEFSAKVQIIGGNSHWFWCNRPTYSAPSLVNLTPSASQLPCYNFQLSIRSWSQPTVGFDEMKSENVSSDPDHLIEVAKPKIDPRLNDALLAFIYIVL